MRTAVRSCPVHTAKDSPHRKVRIYKEYHSVCPLVGIGTLPTPLSPASVPLPPERGGGAHSPAGEGLGESNFRRLEKKLSTLTLWPARTLCILSFSLIYRSYTGGGGRCWQPKKTTFLCDPRPQERKTGIIG